MCTRKIKPTPKKIVYNQVIEDGLSNLQAVLQQEFKLSADLARWVGLKIMDGEEKILQSIESNLSIDLLNNETLQSIKDKVRQQFSQNAITKSNFKDLIVTSIMHKAEAIVKNVCVFEDKNYSKRDRKIDKVLTSKTFGIPMMILFHPGTWKKS